MRRSLTVAGVVLAAALTPLTANATITPDNGYGTGGTATVPNECASVQSVATRVGWAGTVYVAEQCAAGYFRVYLLGSDGKLDTDWGTDGHLTIKFPTACVGSTVDLEPVDNGSSVPGQAGVYLVTAHDAADGAKDLHACMARITRTGKAWWNFGGTTPIRRLDRTGGSNSYVGLALDGDLINVFTAREDSTGTSGAAFINRYGATGRPDKTFSGDGQRAFVQPHQVGVSWGGAFERREVVAIAVNDGHGLVGTQFVRFEVNGDLNKDFGGDGSRFVSEKAYGNARTGPGQIAMDANGRIAFTTYYDGHLGGSQWIDLVRLKKDGSDDSAFDAATQKISTLTDVDITRATLQTTPGHYAVGWDTDTGGAVSARTTGYGGTGDRWTALGPNGTAEEAGNQWAPDSTTFYDFAYNGDPLTTLSVTRSLVQ